MVRPATANPAGMFEIGVSNFVGVLGVLGVKESSAMLRVGPMHYNTVDEIKQFGEVLAEIAKNG